MPIIPFKREKYVVSIRIGCAQLSMKTPVYLPPSEGSEERLAHARAYAVQRWFGRRAILAEHEHVIVLDDYRMPCTIRAEYVSKLDRMKR
jgi:hypothetical protein